MIKISKINPYLKYTKDQIIVNTNNITVKIPKTYLDTQFCKLGRKVETLGIFQLIINNKQMANLILTNMVTTIPSDIDNNSDEEYTLCHFKKGDILIDNTSVIKSPDILYKIFHNFIFLGKFPKFLTYDELSTIFNQSVKVNDMYLPIGKEIFELMISHISRDEKDLTKFYRHTDMKKLMSLIGLNNITYAPSSTTSKILGSYLEDGMTGALIDEKHNSDPIEDLLIT